MRAPGLRTPRIDMHRCSHSITTMTPRGSRMRMIASAICEVSRSCTCGRRANTSTSRANFDRPAILPSGRRDVADVRDPVERNEVVLAGRVHLDVLDQHHLVVAEVEGGLQHVLGLHRQAREDLRVGTRDPGRGLLEPVAVGVLPDREQDLAHRRLDAGQVDPAGADVPGALAVVHGPATRRRSADAGRSRPASSPAGWAHRPRRPGPAARAGRTACRSATCAPWGR